MKLSAQSQTSVVSSLQAALVKYKEEGERTEVTDIHLQPKADSGELVVFNDDDEELSRTRIAEWVDYEGDDFYKKVERVLRSALEGLKEKGGLDHLCLLKPYSFVLVDEEKETITELLLVDEEETLLLSEDLLQGLDEELNAFLKDLLEK